MLSNLFRNLPPVTLNLLIINVLVYLGVMLFPQFYEMLSLHYVESTLFQPHQIVTHMFMHSKYGITHIFFNMFALVMFGSAVEKQIGAKKFLILYFLSRPFINKMKRTFAQNSNNTDVSGLVDEQIKGDFALENKFTIFSN